MRVHCRPIVVLCATALMMSGLSAGSIASADQPAVPPSAESGVSAAAAAVPGTAATSTAPAESRPAGICGTGFGPPVVDGILSWKDPAAAADVAGAADFVCPSPFTITQVDVMGYGGNPTSSNFDVTVYANAPSNEPLNTSAAVCATQNVPGASGSPFPTSLQTTLVLATPCTVPAGTYWVEVQMDDPFSPSTPWYWETQSATGGSFDADWRDALGTFATPCTPGYVDGLTMQDCVFGGPAGEPDFMFDLTGFAPPNAVCNTVDQITGLTDAGTGVASMARGQRPEGADDFVCTGSTPMLDVTTVSWRGRYGNCTPFTCGPAPTFEIRVYSDGGGATPEPANLVCLYSVQYVPGFGSPPAGGYQQSGVPGAANVKTFRAKLPSPCQLANGVPHWVAVQAKLAGPTNWKWRLATGPALGNPGDWQRRLHPLCPTWNNGIYMETCQGFSPGTRPNYLFRIN